MLIYVIPLVILIIVLVVFKKRQDSQESGKTTTAKGKTQKVSSTKKTVTKTKEVADTVVAKKKTTPLAADVRNKIEALIRENNFFSAEAQINQALNKDNSQHELYLLLLDIHILQKDEFAISQLINHLRSLELDDFLEQALAKKEAHEKQAVGSKDTIEFKPSSTVATAAEPALTETKNTADFDALMNDAVAPAATNDLAFDQLQQDQLAPQTAAVEEIKPLDFSSLSLDSAAEAATAPAEEIKPLDFNNLNLDPAPVAESQPEAAPVQEIQPLDFSFSLDTATTGQPATEKAASIEPAVEEKPEFNFDFSIAEAPAAETKVAAEETTPSLDLDFNLEPATPIEEPIAEVVPAKAAGVNFDISNISSSAAKADKNDPLVQSFPELTEVDEINLNLELAQQYIQLGAVESARELLAEQEAGYTPEQRQLADHLRNQIAS
ncbi:fimbrial protein FimV [Acinetobacter sp. G11]|uniref:fimbrial protein FimV n=1 Tax=Acinetobacter sp. G11 TaxID=3415989 RepID=UPI003C7B14CF